MSNIKNVQLAMDLEVIIKDSEALSNLYEMLSIATRNKIMKLANEIRAKEFMKKNTEEK